MCDLGWGKANHGYSVKLHGNSTRLLLGESKISGWIKGGKKIEQVCAGLWDSNFLAPEQLVKRSTPASKCDSIFLR